ncbi:MAG: hypothetical protein Kow0068_14660 [Marinilabiliales bacterium]
MAKKAVATLQTDRDKNMVKVIKMVKSQKTGAYEFKEGMVHVNNKDKFFNNK